MSTKTIHTAGVKEQPLSTKSLIWYKAITISLLSAWILLLLIPDLTSGNRINFEYLLLPVFWLVILIRRLNRLEIVSFDDHAFYVRKKGYEIVVPFHEVAPYCC